MLNAEQQAWVEDYTTEEKRQMPNINQMIESKYLKQSDVDGEMEVTIVKIGQVNVAREDEAPELKWGARFQEFQKPMVLNSTNIQLLAKACGSEESEDWIGKKITIFADPNVSFAGKLVGGLRIKLPIKKAGLKPAGGHFDDMADDIPL